MESVELPLLEGEVDVLPSGLDALILTGDLQGIAPSWSTGSTGLLGVRLAEELVELSEQGVLPYPERTGVVLAGDLYSAPGANIRGASGDVRAVWEAFADAFRWVAGVQGITMCSVRAETGHDLSLDRGSSCSTDRARCSMV